MQDPDARREKALLMAILERALLDYYSKGRWVVGVTNPWESVHRDAKKWIFSRDKCPWSFNWICDMVNCEPKNIRTYILNVEHSSFKTAHLNIDALYRRMNDDLSTATGLEIYNY